MRIKGLFLAVTTLGFAVAMSSWVLKQSWALGGGVVPRPARALRQGARHRTELLLLRARRVRGAVPDRAEHPQDRLRTSAPRRARQRGRGARVRAPRRASIKLQGFLLAGFVAGVGGAAYAHSFSGFGPGTLRPAVLDRRVVFTVVGGIGILAGPLLGVALVQGVPAFVPSSRSRSSRARSACCC